MLESIEINRFRGISKFQINDLKKINIFIGRNNQGKSSILEAIYLASAAFEIKDPTMDGRDKIYSILNRRSQRNINWAKGHHTLWYRYNPEHPIEINLAINHKKRKDNLKIVLAENHLHPLICVPPDIILELARGELADSEISRACICFIDNRVIVPYGRMSRNRTEFDIRQKLEKAFPDFESLHSIMKNIILIDSGLLYKIREVEKVFWSELVRGRKDKLVTAVLKEGYEIDVEDLTYVPIGEEFQLAVKLPETTIRVDDLGDGARYSMIWIMAAALANNTIMLIEEPETHQHPGGLVNSLEILLNLIKKNNIQLFATTHSLDFLKLVEPIALKHNIEIATFFVEMDKEGRVESRLVNPHDSENLRKVGFDVRFLDIL